MSALRRAAFLDRDGTLNVDRGYVHRREDFELLPGVVEGLQLLQEAGLALVVVTNQSGIARGLFGPADHAALSEHLHGLLARQGVRLAGIYHCPHLPDAPLPQWRLDCDCRKPGPGLIRRAARELGLDLAASVLVGDRARDIAAGRAAGVGRCLLVQADAAEARAGRPDGAYADLLAAARAIVAGAGPAPSAAPLPAQEAGA